MLIKKLELINFRAFSGSQMIEFATDDVSNITIIMGENGSGKTTLAQAFLWVLYGETEFKVKELINRVVRDSMSLNEEKKVNVTIHIVYEDKYYIISRSQIYKRYSTKVSADHTEFSVTYVKNGQQEFLKKDEREDMIKKMLPKQLSRFFFFDGERIKTMSDEIERGRSKEFADAVRGLVGLTAVMNAINHLKPSTTIATVIGRYNKKIDESGNRKIADMSSKISKLNQDYENTEKRINEIERMLNFYREESTLLKQQIASHAEAEEMQNEYNGLKAELVQLEKTKVSAVKNFLTHFNSYTPAFLTKPIIYDALKDLSNTKTLDKGIPEMHANTIDFLIKRGYCVCGMKFQPGDEAYNELCKTLEYLPPKSIGIMINQFVNESKNRIKLSESFFEIFEGNYSRIREIALKIEDAEDRLTNLDNRLLDVSTVKNLKQRHLDTEANIKKFEGEQKIKLELIGSIKTKQERVVTERDELILVDERNKEYEIYRQYALVCYEELREAYASQEKLTRQRLEHNINIIFADIFSNALSIKIDDRYNIQVSVSANEFEGDEIERSTAQNYSVIFAFIAGIIKMAKETSQIIGSTEDSEFNIFLEAEGYPLVMDAPLSSFDKKRIKNICTTLPKIARQIIFFIKDTDGEVAEEHLGSVIGAKYNITIDDSQLMAEVKMG